MSRSHPGSAPRILSNDDGEGDDIGTGLDAWLRAVAAYPKGAVVTLAAGYISFHGLMRLAGSVRTLNRAGVPVRILFGVAPTGSAAVSYDAEESIVRLRRLLADGEDALDEELEALDVSSEAAAQLADLVDVLRDPLVQVRRYERGFFHAKAFVVKPVGRPAEVVVGSCNLTRAGLSSNIELAVAAGREEAEEAARRVVDWWRASKPYDLVGMIEERFATYPAALVYLRMLAERFAHEVDPTQSPLG